MNLLKPEQVNVPGDVPPNSHRIYIQNFLRATHATGRLMMFAGDQKIEHLNDDFYSAVDQTIADDDHSPQHLFEIARKSTIGVFATQLGLINQYGRDYPEIPYIAKLNSKSHLVTVDQHEPVSRALWQVADVVDVQNNTGLNIVGVGYTVYLGSEYETDMLHEAAGIIRQAHKEGMLAVIWMYPRGKSVANEKDPHLIAGACGVAVCLGADFVKVNYPGNDYGPEDFRESILAAGRTGVICAGGKTAAPRGFLQQLWDEIHIAGARGNATGRNIHQRSLEQAKNLCDAISAITIGNCDVEFAMQVYQGKESFNLSYKAT